MSLTRVGLLAIRSLTAQSRRGVKITGPIVDTPSVVWRGKVYKKQIYYYNAHSWIDMCWRYMLKNDWYYRYMAISTVFIVFPIVVYFHRLVNTPENKAYWEAKRKSDHEKDHAQPWDILD